MKRLILPGFLVFLLFLSTITAVEHIGSFPKDRIMNISQPCSNCTSVNVTSIYFLRNSTYIVNVVEVMNNVAGTEYIYVCDNCSNISGDYRVTGQADLDGEQEVWVYDYTINPQGIDASDQRTESLSRALYFIFGIGLIIFVAFLFSTKPPIKWTFFIVSLVFFMIGLNIISITLVDEVVNPRLEDFFDSFTAIAFYFYWFAAGLIGIMWFFAFFNTWIYRKNLNNIRRYG